MCVNECVSNKYYTFITIQYRVLAVDRYQEMSFKVLVSTHASSPALLTP